MRFVPEAGTFKVSRPLRIPEVFHRSDEGSPVVAGARRAGQTAKCAQWFGSLRHLVEYALRGSGTDTRQQVQHPKTGDPIARVLHEPQQRKDVLDVRGVKKLQAAKFHERHVATGEFDLQRSAV